MELTLTEIGRESMVRINAIADEIRRQETEAYDRVAQLRAKVRSWSRNGITGLVLPCVVAVFAVLRLRRDRESERARNLAELKAQRVEDDGFGFDPKLVRQGSHGFAGMRFRLRSGGGDLVLRTAPGKGTTIEATLPV